MIDAEKERILSWINSQLHILLYSYICFSKYFSWSNSHPAFSNKMNACIRQRWRWRSEWRGWRMKYALSRQARWHLLPIASMDEEDRLLNLTTRRNRAYADLSITKICPRRFHFFFFFQFKQFPRSLYCRFGIRMLNLLKEQFFFWFITMIYSFKKKKKNSIAVSCSLI